MSTLTTYRPYVGKATGLDTDDQSKSSFPTIVCSENTAADVTELTGLEAIPVSFPWGRTILPGAAPSHTKLQSGSSQMQALTKWKRSLEQPREVSVDCVSDEEAANAIPGVSSAYDLGVFTVNPTHPTEQQLSVFRINVLERSDNSHTADTASTTIQPICNLALCSTSFPQTELKRRLLAPESRAHLLNDLRGGAQRYELATGPPGASAQGRGSGEESLGRVDVWDQHQGSYKLGDDGTLILRGKQVSKDDSTQGHHVIILRPETGIVSNAESTEWR